ncbi:hypothetical protein CGC21_0730 [Leishmania donovani]|uniref:Uncharacterized protein n=1 Tax=Leishmania donovani TaxID=5661 RepID=A0A504XWT0_LEIDO|nr:hypothetical protein CGC21_0730 [Leishmania donovani]
MLSGAAAGARNANLLYTLRSLHNAHYRVREDVAAVLLQEDFFEEASRGEFYTMSYLRHRIPFLFQLALHTWTPQQSRQATPTSGRTPLHHAAQHSTGEEENDREGNSRRSDSDCPGNDEAACGNPFATSESHCVREENERSQPSMYPATAEPQPSSSSGRPETSLPSEQLTQLAVLAVHLLCGDRSRVREGPAEASIASCGPVWDAHTVRNFFEEHRWLVQWTSQVLNAPCEWVNNVANRALEDVLVAQPQRPSGSSNPPRLPSAVGAAPATHQRAPPQQSSLKMAASPVQACSPDVTDLMQSSPCSSSTSADLTEPRLPNLSLLSSHHVGTPPLSQYLSPIGCRTPLSQQPTPPSPSSPAGQRTPRPQPLLNVPAHGESSSGSTPTSTTGMPDRSHYINVLSPEAAKSFMTTAELTVELERQCRRIRHAVMLLESLLVAVGMVEPFLYRRPVCSSPMRSWTRRDSRHRGASGISGFNAADDEDKGDNHDLLGGGYADSAARRQCCLCHLTTMEPSASTGPLAATRHVSNVLDANRDSDEPPQEFLVRHAMHAFTHMFLSITAVRQRLQAYSHERRHTPSTATVATAAAAAAARASFSLTPLASNGPCNTLGPFSPFSTTISGAANLTVATVNAAAASSPCQRLRQLEELLIDAVQDNFEVLKKSAIAFVAHHSAITEEAICAIDAEGAVFTLQATMMLAHVFAPEVLATHPPGSPGGMALEWILSYVFAGCNGAEVRHHQQQQRHYDTGASGANSSLDCFSLMNSSHSSTSTAWGANKLEYADALLCLCLSACFTRCQPLMTFIGWVAESKQYNCSRTVAQAVLQYAFALSQTSARLLRTPLPTSS